jgi:aryl-alcohol dehydrogenase-like predicted oxidoreductase
MRSISKDLLRKTPWFSSLPIAIGTHLGDFSDEDSKLYQESLMLALQSGINFVDTAINYRGMRSERDIGTVLYELIVKDKQINRSQIIVSTKAGLIPGDIVLGLRPDRYLEEILIEPGIISNDDLNIVDNNRHVLAPKYYEFAINKSREHLRINTIDIHYIHNPEISKAILGEDFYKKLIPLFEFYESQVEKGTIRFYGMASWNAFLNDIDVPGYVALEKVVDVAKSVAGDNHHFRFVQMPYNILHPLASNKENQKVRNKMMTAINAANELGLNVTVSATLAQGKGFESGIDYKTLIKYVIDTPGVYAAMVGMKRKHNVESNLKIFT